MRHLCHLPLLFLLFCASCSPSTPPPPTVYTYGSTHHFVVQKQGEAYAEELTLMIGNGPASHISINNGFRLFIGELKGPTASWQRINNITGDTTNLADEVVTDQKSVFRVSYPHTDILALADFVPSLYFNSAMEPDKRKTSHSRTISGMNSIELTDKELERTYLGITPLTLPDTTYAAVHELQAQLRSQHGTIQHTYYFHDSLGFVYSHITMPDSSIITVTRVDESKKKPQI